jgi:hypothetical protein
MKRFQMHTFHRFESTYSLCSKATGRAELRDFGLKRDEGIRGLKETIKISMERALFF